MPKFVRQWMPAAAIWPATVVLLVGAVMCRGVPTHALEPSVVGGCHIGAEVPTFYLREVVGPRPNLALCLVCRYGSRPVVLISARTFNESIARLIEKIDRTVDAHRGQGLRGFAMFVDQDPRQVQPQLATLARQRNITLPLTIPVEVSGPRTMDLPREADVTVIIYRGRRVAQRYLLDSAELTDEAIAAVADAAIDLAR
jgi:hypothetical protein